MLIQDYQYLDACIMYQQPASYQQEDITISTNTVKAFDVPMHRHQVYELTLLLNAKGVQRVVGNSISVIDDIELVLIGPNLYHAWFMHSCTYESVIEVTIQFNKEVFEGDLCPNQFSFLDNLFIKAQRGIAFPRETITGLIPFFLALKEKNRSAALADLQYIMHTLSVSPNIKLLSDLSLLGRNITCRSHKIEKVYDFMFNNYEKPVMLNEVATLANMSGPSFSRFIKKQTGKTFVETLNDIRLYHASNMLIDTDLTICRIAYTCGFNNISNFNRIFKRKRMYVPKKFREIYTTKR